MSSRNPNNDIAMKMIFEDDYDPCKVLNKNPELWADTPACDQDFVPDFANGYCYKVLRDKKSLDDGEKFCQYKYDAELILFEENLQVDGLIGLIETGEDKNVLA